MSITKIAAVVGVGPGLGSSVARRFAKEGYTVALVARGKDKLDAVKNEIEKNGGKADSFPADCTDPKQIASAFDQIRKNLGNPEVVPVRDLAHFPSILDISPESFESHWKSNCFGGFLCTKEVLPHMVKEKKGTIILTGATASLRGSAKFANLAVGKFGLRAFSQSLAREFHPQGIHVAHVIIDGGIDLQTTRERQPDRPIDSLLNPDAIADSYWHLHTQDKTAWTQELDLRPYVEKF